MGSWTARPVLSSTLSLMFLPSLWACGHHVGLSPFSFHSDPYFGLRTLWTFSTQRFSPVFKSKPRASSVFILNTLNLPPIFRQAGAAGCDG